MRSKLKLMQIKYCTWRKLNEGMLESIIFRENYLHGQVNETSIVFKLRNESKFVDWKN